MKLSNPLWVAILAGALGLGAAGCGDDDGGTGLTCGTGTVEQNGMCVPSSEVTCGTGTVLVDGECVPDGTVICDDGTVYSAETGTCVVDGSACADGTVFDTASGTCIPFDDTLVGDNHEADENNDPAFGGTAGTFTAGEVGEVITFDGCVVPDDFDGDTITDPDVDAWEFTVDEPTMLRIKVDGKDGISAGFVVTAADDQLVSEGWRRFGVNLVSDGAERKVYLPKAGTYTLGVGDARSFFLGSPAGDPAGSGCYYMELEQVGIPDAEPMTSDTVTGTFGDPQFYFFNATETGELRFNSITQNSPAVNEALVQIRNDEFDTSAIGFNPTTVSAGLEEGDQVTLVVDYDYDYSLDAVPFTLLSDNFDAHQADGTVTVEHSDEFYRFMWFSANAGDVVEVDWQGNENLDEFTIDLINPDFTQILGVECDFFLPCSSDKFWVQAQQAGIYYIRFYNTSGVAPLTYTVDVKTTAITPKAVAVGTPAAGSLVASERDFFELDLSDQDWLEFTLADLVDMTNGSFTFYDRAGDGILGSGVPVLDNDAVQDGDAFGRIVSGESQVYLIAVNDSDGYVGSETFGVTVGERDYSDLGTVDPETPVEAAGESVAAGEVERYLVHAVLGSTVTFSATGTGGFDPLLDRLDRVETRVDSADGSGANGVETLSAVVGRAGWVAFTVSGASAESGTYDVSVSATPPPYNTTKGALAFVDICPGAGGAGTLITFDDTDEGLATAPIDLPFAFSLFDDAATEATVSTNGWITLETGYSGGPEFINAEIPSEDLPNGVIAPMWTDIWNAVGCVQSSADELTVQWQGQLFFSDIQVEVQTVLHSDGSIDFIYGDALEADGNFTTVGIENLAGTEGLQVGFNDPTSVAPGTSYTFVPTAP